MPEIAKSWFKSSESTGYNNCVETQMYTDGSVDVRDSKDKSGPVLHYTADEWNAFLGGARKGEFDLA
jgi:hypothetical protein